MTIRNIARICVACVVIQSANSNAAEQPLTQSSALMNSAFAQEVLGQITVEETPGLRRWVLSHCPLTCTIIMGNNGHTPDVATHKDKIAFVTPEDSGRMYVSPVKGDQEILKAELVKFPKVLKPGIQSIAFNPSDDEHLKILTTTAVDKKAHIWDLKTKTIIAEFPHEPGNGQGATVHNRGVPVYNKSGTHIAAFVHKLLTINDMKSSLHINDRAHAITCVAFNDDGSLIASGSDDGCISLRNATTGNCYESYQLTVASGQSAAAIQGSVQLAFNHTGNRIAANCNNHLFILDIKEIEGQHGDKNYAMEIIAESAYRQTPDAAPLPSKCIRIQFLDGSDEVFETVCQDSCTRQWNLKNLNAMDKVYTELTSLQMKFMAELYSHCTEKREEPFVVHDQQLCASLPEEMKTIVAEHGAPTRTTTVQNAEQQQTTSTTVETAQVPAAATSTPAATPAAAVPATTAVAAASTPAVTTAATPAATPVVAVATTTPAAAVPETATAAAASTPVVTTAATPAVAVAVVSGDAKPQQTTSTTVSPQVAPPIDKEKQQLKAWLYSKLIIQQELHKGNGGFVKRAAINSAGNRIVTLTDNEWHVSCYAGNGSLSWVKRIAGVNQSLQEDLPESLAMNGAGDRVVVIPQGSPRSVINARRPVRASLLNGLGDVIATLPAAKDPISEFSCATFSHDGSEIASGSKTQTVAFWNGQNGEYKAGIPVHQAEVLCVAYDPTDKFIVSGGQDKLVQLIQREPLQKIKTYEGHTDEVRTVNFSDDNLQIVSGGDDQTARIWDIATGTCLRKLNHNFRVKYVQMIRNSKKDQPMLATTNGHNIVALWDQRQAKAVDECVATMDSLQQLLLAHICKTNLRGDWYSLVKNKAKPVWDTLPAAMRDVLGRFIDPNEKDVQCTNK